MINGAFVPVPTLSERGSTILGFAGIGTSGIKMYFVYVLKSEKSGKYYTGSTSNIIKRIHQHNSGFSKYTKNKGPWNLIYKEEFDSLNGARKREKQIKSWKKRLAIEKLINAPVV